MKQRILIVEDFEPSAELLRVWLSSLGFVVDVAPGGCEALALHKAARAEHRDYSVIVLDLAMPEMGGFEVAENIRLTDTDIEIAIWSANVDSLGIARAALLGITEIMRKPTPLEQIESAIRRCLERSRGNLVDKQSKCPKCEQINKAQTGEHPCEECGLPILHDEKVNDT